MILENYLLEIQSLVVSLPIRKGDFELAASYPDAHDTEQIKHAVDFLCPVGTEVLAVLPGTITDVVDHFKEYGDMLKFAQKVNYITIQHEDNLFSQYLHLGVRQTKVKIGMNVKQGQVIGTTGLSGYMTAPHLHFHMCVMTDNEKGWKTIPVNFKPHINIVRENYLLEIQIPPILYHSSSKQGLKYLDPAETQSTHLKHLKNYVYASDEKSYSAAFCFEWHSVEGFKYGKEDKTSPNWVLQIPKRFEERLKQKCSLYYVSSKGFKKVYGATTPEFVSKEKVEIIKEERYKSARDCLEKNNVEVVII